MRKLLLPLTIVLLLAACGLNNTMYNAKQYFKTAQARPLSANGRPTAQAVDDYTKTIRKCGIILSEHKKSRQADEALFLMARALYYKGNSAFQAKDAFEGLIVGYPESKHVPEAHIYLAKVLREVNMIPESEALLEQFVRNPKYIKQHPRALLVLADYEIKDEDYHRAQYWLQRIITDYRKTPEFKEAFFLFGKNYFMQKDYERSLAEFQTFVKTRGISKEMKLEAGYYIALNKYMLADYDVALKNTRSLIRNEVRPEKLSALRVLYSRILLAKGNEEAGIAEFEDLVKKYPRTEQSAEAFYHFGNYYYFEAKDIDKAIQNLNKVRTEFTKSPYAERASKIAAALGQMKKPANLNSRQNLQAFLDHYYLKAEYFISPLALPDSALISYQTVIDERVFLATDADSLELRLMELSAQIDSISALPEVMLAEEMAVNDSLKAETLLETDEMDDLELDDLPENQIAAVADSIQVADDIGTLEDIAPENPAPTDEYAFLEEELPEDAFAELEESEDVEAEPVEELETEEQKLANLLNTRQLAQDEFNSLNNQLEAINEILERFDNEILPFCYFSMYSLYHEQKDKDDEKLLILGILQELFPRNMYTRAALALDKGLTPRLVDLDLEAAEDAFDLALAYYPEYPDSLVNAMLDFSESAYPELKLKANYRLGWHYSFEAPDTSLAKNYLTAVLEDSEAAEYGQMINRFYDGSKYLLRDSGLPDSLIVIEEPVPSEAEADTMFIAPLPEAAGAVEFDFEIPELDSLLLPVEAEVADSLMILPEEPEADEPEAESHLPETPLDLPPPPKPEATDNTEDK